MLAAVTFAAVSTGIPCEGGLRCLCWKVGVPGPGIPLLCPSPSFLGTLSSCAGNFPGSCCVYFASLRPCQDASGLAYAGQSSQLRDLLNRPHGSSGIKAQDLAPSSLGPGF